MPARACFCALLPLLLCSCGRSRMEITGGPYLVGLGPSDATVVWVTSAPAETVLEVWTEEALPPTHLEALSTVHEVHLSGLAPGTVHHYRVSAGSARSPILSFRTPPAEPGKLVFVAYGETAGSPERHARLVEAMAEHDPAFVVHTGGLVSGADTLEEWKRDVFEPTRALLAGRPFVPVRGPSNGNSARFRRFFPGANGAAWHSLRFHNVEVLSLDLGVPFTVGGEQYEWVDRVLGHSRADWKVVVVARPLFSAGPSGGDAALRRALFPLLLRAGADLVLCGGDAVYERTLPIGSGPEPEGNAIVEFVTGGGGSPATVRPGPWTAYAESVPHYLLIEVKGEELTASGTGLDGRVLDTVSLRRVGKLRLHRGALSAEALEGLLAFLPREGFDLGQAAGQPVTRECAVAIENPYDTPIQGELAWQTSSNAWTLDPASSRILVPPLGLQQVTFQVTARPPDLDPFPAPVFTASEQTLKAGHSPFRVVPQAPGE